ncbi:hypothetical protein GGR58DRAFT_526118 [Xylaria digitata]|nr:hypothetical protein GGR58DRAFT_526118 [Xylaria digitata]
MSSRQIIQDWVDSVGRSITPGLPQPIKSTTPLRSIAVPTKRVTDLDTTIVLSNTPSTPPLTGADRSIPQVALKRHSDQIGSEEEEEEEEEEGAHAADMHPPPALPQSRPRSQSELLMKCIKTDPKRGNLSLLEKPFSIVGLGAGALATKTIPEDIRGLCKDIRAAVQFKHGIILYEVRDQILALKADLPDAIFREPTFEIAPLPSHASPGFKSEQCKRLEAAWNNHVNTLLLELVFGSDLWDPEGFDGDQPVVARFEAVMGATIVGTAILFIKLSQLDQLDLACSVSLNSSAGGTNINSDCGIDIAKLNLTELHGCSESKKVDYVLVMYINGNERLRQVIWDISFEKRLGYSHVD